MIAFTGPAAVPGAKAVFPSTTAAQVPLQLPLPFMPISEAIAGSAAERAAVVDRDRKLNKANADLSQARADLSQTRAEKDELRSQLQVVQPLSMHCNA